MADGRIPVQIVGGFLGSGKTSLLRETLDGEPDTAVIVNEFGAVGLDHELLRAVEERVQLVGGGCACCTRREDLVGVLRELLDARDRGIAGLRRVVIETSGLADPAPIVFTLTHDPMLRHHFEVEHLLVTVDAVNCTEQLATHPEAAKQILVADELVVTKVDLVEPEQTAAVAAALRTLNPAAAIRTAVHGVVSDTVSPAAAEPETDRDATAVGAPGIGPSVHTADVASLSLNAGGPIDWLGFAVWLSMLLHARGQEVLRVKGLLELDDGTLVSVNGVQHVVHQPEHLQPGSVRDPSSNLVFITRGIKTDRLRESFHTFQRLARAGNTVQA